MSAENAKTLTPEAAVAVYEQGWNYHHGQGVPQDYVLALRCYQRAADAGNVKAMFGVGWMHENGLGTFQDLKEKYHDG